MPKFLSDDWFGAVEDIQDEAPEPPAAIADLKINILIEGGDDGTKEAHLDAGTFGRGNIEGAATKLTVPYETAKSMFIEGDQAAVMQAFMSGQIKVEGDMARLMAMQSANQPSPEQEAFQERLRSLTD